MSYREGATGIPRLSGEHEEAVGSFSVRVAA